MGKKLFAFVCALSTALSMFAWDFTAETPSGHTLVYTIVDAENKYVQLDGHNDNPPTGDLIIPSTVTYNDETYYVKSIKNSAFFECSKITSLVIEEGIEEIGDQAFQGCTRLKTVSLPNTLITCGIQDFALCKNLETVNIPTSLTVLPNAMFRECTSLKTIDIPANIETIGEYAFYICSSLTTVHFHEGLKNINSSVFGQAYALSEIEFPSSLTYIGKQAFDSDKIQTITIPENVTEIDEYAFIYCSSLRSIYLKSEEPALLGETPFPAREDLEIYVPCGSLESYAAVDEWLPYKNYLKTSSHVVSALTNDVIYGYVRVDKTASCEETYTAVLTAVSSNDVEYQFGSWSDGNTDNPRTITISQDTAFVATFGIKPKILNLASQDPICTSATGSASFDIIDGVAPYTILWNDGNTDNPRTDMKAGTYFVVVKDAEGYTSDTTYVYLNPIEDNMPVVDITSVDPICETENGSIVAQVSGGVEPYTYTWEQQLVLPVVFWNFNETFAPTVDVADARFYIASNYNEPDHFDEYTLNTYVDGASGTDKALNVKVAMDSVVAFKLTMPFTEDFVDAVQGYTNDTKGVAFYHKGTSVDLYTVGVNDIMSEYSIPYHAEWTRVELTWDELTYLNDIAGFIIQSSDDNYIYDFSIDEFEILYYDDGKEISTADHISELPEGLYSIEVNDYYGCAAELHTKLMKDYSILPDIVLTSISPICETENGSIEAEVSNGMEPYAYVWNDGSLEQHRENLSEGEYTVTVTDSYGCAQTLTTILEKDYTTLPEFTFAITNPICETDNGTIITTVQSGTAPYTYTWEDVVPSVLIDFESGYTTEYFSKVELFSDVNYGGTTDISASAIVEGGAQGSGHALKMDIKDCTTYLSGDKAGLYTQMGSSVVGYAELNVGISFYHKGSAVIFRAFNQGGMLEEYIEEHADWTPVQFIFNDYVGDGTPYTSFYWVYRDSESDVVFYIDDVEFLTKQRSEATSQNRDSLSVGMYQLTVTDTYGCEYTAVTELEKDETNVPVISKTVNQAICGHDVGEIAITYEGGTEPITWKWTDSDTTVLTRSLLSPGVYEFTVTDTYGCTDIDTTEIVAESFKYNPELALVTVSQEVAPYNLVIWQKEETEALDYYSIYRETENLNKYVKLVDVPYSEVSLYVDEAANSQKMPYRYKISATDYCGNESELSDAHKTMHLQKNMSVGIENNLLWTAYEGFAFSTYSIFRITKDGVEEIDKVNSGVLTYSDLEPAEGTISYYVGVVLPSVIYVNEPYKKAESGPFSLAISNIAEAENTGSTVVTEIGKEPVSVYAVDNAITIENAGEQQIIVSNVLGQTLVRTTGTDEPRMNIPMQSGVYIVIVGNTACKVVVE